MLSWSKDFLVGTYHSVRRRVKGGVKWAPKTGPRAKVYNGAEHQARGGAD